MVNRVLMWAAAAPGLQRQVTENPNARRAADRSVAGERPEKALEAPPSVEESLVTATDHRYPYVGG